MVNVMGWERPNQSLFVVTVLVVMMVSATRQEVRLVQIVHRIAMPVLEILVVGGLAAKVQVLVLPAAFASTI